MAMDDFEVSDLPSQSIVINLAATCGQGEFPVRCLPLLPPSSSSILFLCFTLFA